MILLIVFLFSQVSFAELSDAPISNMMAHVSGSSPMKKTFRIQIRSLDKCTSVVNSMRRQEIRFGTESAVTLSSLGIYYANQQKLGVKLLALTKEIDLINGKMVFYKKVDELQRSTKEIEIYKQEIEKLRLLRDSLSQISAEAEANGLAKIESVRVELQVLKAQSAELTNSIVSIEKDLAGNVSHNPEMLQKISKNIASLSARLGSLGAAISGGTLAKMSGELAKVRAGKTALKSLGFIGKRVIPVVGTVAMASDIGALLGWIADRGREFHVSTYPGADYLNDYSVFNPKIDSLEICKKVMNIPGGSTILEEKADDVFNGAQAGYESEQKQEKDQIRTELENEKKWVVAR